MRMNDRKTSNTCRPLKIDIAQFFRLYPLSGIPRVFDVDLDRSHHIIISLRKIRSLLK